MNLPARPLGRTTLPLTGACLVAALAMAAPAVAAPGGAASAGHATVVAAAPVATTTSLTTTRNPTYSAQSGGLTARVSRKTALGVPTGTVDFYVDGQWWWTQPLDGTGRAQLLYSDLGLGTHTVSAVYSGDASYAGSTSTELTQTVLATAPTAAMTYTPAAVAPGHVSRLVLSATNQTPVNMTGLAMGVMLPAGATIVSMPPGAGCRRAIGSLFYCLTSARPGVTRKIVVDVTAPAAPTVITTSGYARNIDTMDETGASATLSVG
jgi:hypothetical protein